LCAETSERKVTELNFCSPRYGSLQWVPFLLVVAIIVSFQLAVSAQETPKTGVVNGIVSSTSGTPLPGARVTIAGRATQTSVVVKTDSAGTYTSEPVPAGVYYVRVELKDFDTTSLRIEVKAGETTHGDAKIRPINPGAGRVASQVSGTELKRVPIDGRNFLDLIEEEPGVQENDGATLNPSKSGLLALSINGRSGRTTWLQLDGLDIGDETAGTTTQNVAADAVSELRLTRSLVDSSHPIGEAGTLNVITKSGAEALHGNAFYNFRDHRIGFASSPGGLDLPFQRNQFGGSVGGALIKDSVFFFVSAERTKQDADNPVAFTFPFHALSSGYHSPWHETMAEGRLDWVKPGFRAFYRFTYDNNSDVWSLQNLSPFLNRNNIPGQALGADFTTGSFTHSVRFGYNKLVNSLAQPTNLGVIVNPEPQLNLALGQLQTGPSTLAPQTTIQRNVEVRYDGSKPWQSRYGPHTIRFGGGLNKIDAGGYAAFGSQAATVSSSPSLATVLSVLNNPNAPFPALVAGDPAGGADNPLNYPVNGITLYNGNGFFSEKSAFGFPGGGQSDTRLQAYGTDVWRVRHNLNVSLGMSYVRDTGRTDSDIAQIPCAAINRTLVPVAPCTGNIPLLDQFGFISGLGARVRQPNLNFAPQFGVAWDPGSNGRTVVRAGAGVYYANNLFRNIWFDRRSRVASGQFFGSASLCPAGTALFPNGSKVSSIDGLNIGSQICGQPIGDVAGAIADLQSAYQAAARSVGPGTNPYFVGNTLNTFDSLLAPTYQSPRVIQMNLGFQRAIGRRGTLSIDYLRTVGTHFLLGVDTNHVGDASHLDANAALSAMTATLQANAPGCLPGLPLTAGSSALTAVNCYLRAVPGASITDFASHGLDSGNAYCGGYPCAILGKQGAAFSGVNPLVGSNVMYFPSGRSVYSGLQISLKSGIDRPARLIRHVDYTFSYTFSRYKDDVSQGSDGAIAGPELLTRALDYNNPSNFFGPAGLDRTNLISIGPVFQLPRGLVLSALGQFASPLPLTLFEPQAGGGGVPGEIFRSDTTGDGTVGDVLPGSKVGSFGRGTSVSGLNTVISAYNQLFGGRLTPAGNQLVNQFLFTPAQLITLGAVTPILQPAPTGNAGATWLKSFDLRLQWPLRVREGLTVEPSVAAFNIFNLANFDGAQQLLSGVLDASPGRAVNNATNSANCGIVAGICTARSNQTGFGSGVYALGAPRRLEFGVKVTF
jgi:hypothetical protein